MKTTENYGLKKPESTDFYNVEDQNYNMEKIDKAIKSQETEIESLKKSVADGKAQLATTISEGGVDTASDAAFATMAANIETAFENKYDDGEAAGYSAGYNSGVAFADGRTNTSSASYTSGYSAGETAGYNSGYNAGVAAGGDGKFVGKSGSTTYNNSGGNTGWKQITINTGLSHVEEFAAFMYRSDNTTNGAGFSSWTANGGTVTINAYVSTVSYKIDWVAYGS